MDWDMKERRGVGGDVDKDLLWETGGREGMVWIRWRRWKRLGMGVGGLKWGTCGGGEEGGEGRRKRKRGSG